MQICLAADFQKLSFLFLLAAALIFGMQLSKNQAEAKVPAKMLKEVSRLMKGKYDYYSQQGLYKVRYEAVVKNGKITELTCYLAWKGNDISTSSSLGLLEN